MKRPPVPAGRGIFMVVLGVLVLIAVIYQFTNTVGPAAEVEKGIKQDRWQPPVARPHEEKPAAGTPAMGTPSREPPPREPPQPAGGGDLPTDPAAVRALGQILSHAPKEARESMRAYVVPRLTALVDHPVLGADALDAALHLVDTEAEHIADLVEAARTTGLVKAATAAPAVMFLDLLPDAEWAATEEVFVRLVADGNMPLHARLLAARSLTRREAATEARAQVAADASTPAVLKEALSAP